MSAVTFYDRYQCKECGIKGEFNMEMIPPFGLYCRNCGYEKFLDENVGGFDRTKFIQIIYEECFISHSGYCSSAKTMVTSYKTIIKRYPLLNIVKETLKMEKDNIVKITEALDIYKLHDEPCGYYIGITSCDAGRTYKIKGAEILDCTIDSVNNKIFKMGLFINLFHHAFGISAHFDVSPCKCESYLRSN